MKNVYEWLRTIPIAHFKYVFRFNEVAKCYEIPKRDSKGNVTWERSPDERTA